jgi:short-subunit dehydrogenase
VLTEELRGTGVRVGILSAGAVDTPLWDAIPNAPDRSLMVAPAQVAEAALFMATLAPNAALEELTLMPARGVL